MLKNIDPALNADVLHALCSMGHGDEVAIVDNHYAAEKAARHSTLGKLLRIEAGDSATAMRAILSVFELDSFVKQPVERMEVDGQPEEMPNVHQEVQAEIDRATGKSLPMATIPRQDFYERAKKVFCVIITGETRGWGCYILKNGLGVTPDAPASEGNTTLSHYKI